MVRKGIGYVPQNISLDGTLTGIRDPHADAPLRYSESGSAWIEMLGSSISKTIATCSCARFSGRMIRQGTKPCFIAPSGLEQRDEHLDAGGFASPVRIRNANNFPRLDLEGDVIYPRPCRRNP